MSLAITIELGDADLKHFIDAMQVAQEEAKNLSPHEITDAASQLLVDGKDNEAAGLHRRAPVQARQHDLDGQRPGFRAAGRRSPARARAA